MIHPSLANDTDMDEVDSKAENFNSHAKAHMTKETPSFGTVKVMTRVQAQNGITDHTNDNIGGFPKRNFAQNDALHEFDNSSIIELKELVHKLSQIQQVPPT